MDHLKTYTLIEVEKSAKSCPSEQHEDCNQIRSLEQILELRFERFTLRIKSVQLIEFLQVSPNETAAIIFVREQILIVVIEKVTCKASKLQTIV